MGAKAKNVGGGAATAVATDWNNFLRGGLNSGSFGQGMLNQAANNNPTNSAVGQTAGIGGAINNALGGNSVNVGPASGNYQQVLSQMGNFNPAQLGQIQMPQAGQQYQGIQNFAQLNPQGTDFSQFQNLINVGANIGGINPLMGMGGGASQVGAGGGGNIANIANQLANNASGFSPDRVNSGQLSNMMGQTQNAAGANFNPFQAGGADFTGPSAQAIKQIADRQLQETLNDVRSRYSAGGGQMFGTSAQNAEGQVIAQAIPQMMAQLGQLNQNEAQIQNANNSLNLQGMLGANQSQQNAVGLNNSALQNNIGNLLNATQINQQGTIAGGQLGNQSAGTALDALLGLRGQNLGASSQNAANALQSRGLDINQLGQFLNFAGSNYGNQLGAAGQLAGLQNSQNQAMNDFGLQQRGQDINSFLQQAGLNSNMLQYMGQLGLQQNDQLLNQQNLAQQLLGMQGNLALGGDQMMNQYNQANAFQNSQNQMNMLQMLMGAMQQSNQLGTAQRQTVMQPSQWGQALSAVGAIGGAIAGGPAGASIGSQLGSMFGGGNQSLMNMGPAIQNIPIPQIYANNPLAG